MTINLIEGQVSIDQLFEPANRITMFSRGSSVYGTMTERSDNDIAIIVPDDTEFIESEFTDEKCDTRIHQTTLHMDNMPDTDVQLVRESDFIEMINDHEIFALEGIFLYDEDTYMVEGNKIPVTDYQKYFALDKWKLREVFNSKASNSFVKAKKKMTVKKDLDPVCGAKSLFHSIRLLMFACQIAENGKIVDYSEGNWLYEDILRELSEGYDWNKFKEVYKPIWNVWHSKLVKLCPKPRSKHKPDKQKIK